MRLDTFLKSTDILAVEGAVAALNEIEITQLCYDSRQVIPGALFFALAGQKSQGVTFVEEAIRSGASAVVAEEAIPGITVPVLRVANARRAMGEMADFFYHSPSHSLAVCGVTGTNGKTTTTFLVHHLCESSGRRCGLIGTVKYILPTAVEEATRTTPESIDLQKMMHQMREGGFKAVAIETSSHAIVQERLRAVEFDVAIFTNLTQDHLDFHQTMENYFDAKAQLFKNLAEQKEKRGKAVINIDDRYGRLLIDRLPSQLSSVTYGQSIHADFRASNIRYGAMGTQFCLEARGRSYLVRSSLIGLFNVYNALAALASATSMGLELRRAIKALETAPQVPGRLERVPGKYPFQVFVDYAHTPDALENVLRTLQQLKQGRLIVVFGCGGDRDRAKRPLMAAAAERYADRVFVTTDNPRTEDPLQIIADIQKGFQKKGYHAIADRAEAIQEAIRSAAPGDIIVIAGKGHENYQEVHGVKMPFDDVAMAQRALRDLQGIKREEIHRSGGDEKKTYTFSSTLPSL